MPPWKVEATATETPYSQPYYLYYRHALSKVGEIK